jgi:hypothetical protein
MAQQQQITTCFSQSAATTQLRRCGAKKSLIWVWLFCGMIGAATAQTTPTNPASKAGEIEFMRGVGFAQSAGQTPRTMGKGLALQEGDRITTAEGATAVVKLGDGTRMTVRPNTEMVLSQFKYRQDAQDNGMVMNLLRGGLRAITGLISKSSPNAARIQTNTATIGIRGTDFDARICSRDCSLEASRTKQNPKPNAVQASAKLLSARGGDVTATDTAGQRRRVVEGGGIYPGDLIETGPSTQAILAFRDESRVTVGAVTRFRVDNFIYDAKNAGEGRMFSSLLKGTVRALSGLIAKANNRNVSYSTSTATIGIRGTEILMRCTGVCAGEAATPGDGLSVYTYSGSVEVARATPSSATQTVTLTPMQGVFMDAQSTNALNSEPANDLALPGSLPTPPSFFESGNLNEAEEGLYVFVRDGHIELTTNSEVLHLGHNEAGFVGGGGLVTRPADLPRFIEFDRIPLPNLGNFNVISLLGDSDIRSGPVCR